MKHHLAAHPSEGFDSLDVRVVRDGLATVAEVVFVVLEAVIVAVRSSCNSPLRKPSRWSTGVMVCVTVSYKRAEPAGHHGSQVRND